jgi:hypothetical protein
MRARLPMLGFWRERVGWSCWAGEREREGVARVLGLGQGGGDERGGLARPNQRGKMREGKTEKR